jgi:hypothetical protein
VIYDLDLGPVIDAVPCEDAHAQGRTLIGEMTAGCDPGDLFVGGRNSCVARWFLRVHRRGGHFLVRRHATAVHLEPLAQFVAVGRTATGEVQEQRARVVEMDGHGRPRLDERGQPRPMELRRPRVLPDVPTQGGDTEVLLLCGAPARDADAPTLADL